MGREWESLEAFFEAIADENYVVMRNYETLTADMVNSDHPDIDFLCEDSARLCSVLGLSSRRKREDGIHYKARIAGKRTDIDLRHVGDGYYDSRWERDLLASRVLFEGLCYVPDKEQYYYSLLYHALIQKNAVSKDYMERLSGMREDVALSDRLSMVKILEGYMREHGYRYTYPEYAKGIFNTRDVSREMIEKNGIKKIKHDFVRLFRFVKKRIVRR